MGRIMWTGAWLSVLPSTIIGMELGVQEWRYSLFLCYGINPPDLSEHCNECGVVFDICNDLDCKKIGLITACHNYPPDGVADLVNKVFTPTHMHDNTKIYTGHAVCGGK